ncbi:MAG: ATP-binding protein [Armatimonadetes bacterium]|nr:ATP-binding protein [Armatimonadota bacterium]
MTDYCSRELGARLLAALADMPVVVLTGMRQVGKSTLLQVQPELRGRGYLTLDEFAHLEEARRNPETFLRGETVTIDEVQRCPELLSTIKLMVDRDRRPGRFLLSGSANILLLKNITESLAGRAVYLTLHPFNRREICRTTGSEPFLIRFMQSPEIALDAATARPVEPSEAVLGGMPVVCLQEVRDPSLWFKGFEQTYLERDLRELSQVADLISFRHLLHLAALRTGQVLKTSELARDAKLNTPTASRYLSLLEVSFVLQRLLPYLGKPSSRLIKSPKLYLTDSGLACYLMGLSDAHSVSNEALWGAVFENYVAQNLFSLLEAHSPLSNIFFWNVQGRHEVDFIIETRGTTIAIEVKAASRWGDKDLSHLLTFLTSNPNCRAAVLAHNGTKAVRIGEHLWALPLGLLLS